MIYRKFRKLVGLNQGIGGARNRSFVAQRTQHRPGESGFATAQLALEKDDPASWPRRQRIDQLGGKISRGFGVWQRQRPLQGLTQFRISPIRSDASKPR